MQDATQRRTALTHLYQAAKQPFLDTVKNYKTLRIVDLLEGTPNIILVGPAGAWKLLLKEQTSVATDPRFDMIPNTPDWATTT